MNSRSSATALRLREADQCGLPAQVKRGTSQFPPSPKEPVPTFALIAAVRAACRLRNRRRHPSRRQFIVGQKRVLWLVQEVVIGGVTTKAPRRSKAGSNAAVSNTVSKGKYLACPVRQDAESLASHQRINASGKSSE